MLRIKKLTLHNFGAFYGTHSIEISQNEGVVLIWGENGNGKTTIMNAFRFVLWNQIISRTGRKISPSKYVNLRSIPERGSMYVEVVLTYNETIYTITRSYERRSGNGENESDYFKSFNVLENGQALSQDIAIKTLNSMLPVEISRFYLFDVELMAEYEKLLDPENTDGEKIKSAIEDLLGMPILINGRAFVQDEAEAYRSLATKIAGQDSKCKALATKNETNRLILNELRKGATDLTTERESLLLQQVDIKTQMKSNKKLLEYLSKKDKLESALEQQKNVVDNDLEQLQSEIDNSWKSILYNVVEDVKNANQNSIDELSEGTNYDNFAESIFQLLKAHRKDCTCPTCQTVLSTDAYTKLIESYESALKVGSQNRETIDNLRITNRKISSFVKVDNKNLISTLTQNLRLHQASVLITKGKIDDILTQIKQEGVNDNLDKDILELPLKLSEVEGKLLLNQQAIDKNDSEISKMTKSIEELDKMIELQAVGQEYEIANEKAKVVESLKQLFDDSITKFRNELIENVESDATNFFRRITKHPDQYHHLQINDNFGLEIMHADGMPVPNRSSGEEQIVAFSLVSALHKNAPVDGPIFMDSTFQKIDPGHQINTVESLQSFNTQLIIVVYPKEIFDIEQFYSAIGSQLLREYEIVKVENDTFKSTLRDYARS